VRQAEPFALVDKLPEQQEVNVDRARAVAYLSEGNYLWNSGMFLFEAGVFAREAEQHMPELWAQAGDAVTKGRLDGASLTLDATAFAASERISIDYALFEKSNNVAVVPAAFNWSDVGGWAAVHDALPQDVHCNATVGTHDGFVIQQDSQNSLLIRCKGRLWSLFRDGGGDSRWLLADTDGRQ
jgi:mannose-1-phosphate guanylyltransferase